MRKSARCMAKTLLIFEMNKVKDKFRKWYGCLSVIELSLNSHLVRKIQDVENHLNEITSDGATTNDQILELKKLEIQLRKVWESLTPSEQSRRIVFKNFLEVQQQLRSIQERNYKQKETNI